MCEAAHTVSAALAFPGHEWLLEVFNKVSYVEKNTELLEADAHENRAGYEVPVPWHDMTW